MASGPILEVREGGKARAISSGGMTHPILEV